MKGKKLEVNDGVSHGRTVGLLYSGFWARDSGETKRAQISQSLGQNCTLQISVSEVYPVVG